MEVEVSHLGVFGVLGVLGVVANEPALFALFALFALAGSDRTITIPSPTRTASNE
ncbi:MAG: hypothetical protein ABEH83_06220 [Halobacterium sp.]